MRLLIGGSPCTLWSIAQTRNRETQPEGIGWELFKNYLIARDKFHPSYFLYENNKSMASAIREQITQELGVEPILINSALLSAQNRQRLYWTNIPGVKQPEDLGIVLRNILETGLPLSEKTYTLKANYSKSSAINAVDDGHFPAPMVAEPVNVTGDGKAQCLRATYYKDGIRNMVGNVIDRKTCVAIPVHMCGMDQGFVNPTSIDGYQFIQGEATERSANQFLGGLEKDDGKRWLADGKSYSRNFNQGRRLFGVDGKSATVTAQGFGLAGHAGLYAVPIGVEEKDGLHVVPADCDVVITDVSIRCQRQDKKYNTEPGRHVNLGEGKSQTCSVSHSPMVILTPDGRSFTVYEVKDGCISINGQKYPIKLDDGLYIIRKLTVRECMRLQTVPEDYIFPVSATQAYKMLGNGWTIDVIAHILSFCPGITSEPLDVLSMYDGMSCGRLALNKLKANISRYYASEIDKYAVKTTLYNFPDTIQLGDAFQVREDGWVLPKENGGPV